MAVKEGVIKYTIQHTPAAPMAATELSELNAWRKILVLLKLIGQDPARYAGYGFGNISRRVAPWDAAPEERHFVITGTQTGDIADLQPEDFTVVVASQSQKNTIVSEGPAYPSSESLTHGIIYDMDDSVRWVMHAHSPEIWRHAQALGIPVTDATVAYGSPEMANEVVRLFAETDVASQHIFAMGGHEDGIVTFGQTAEEAGSVMLFALANAMARN
ncbi:MAG: class II aldolase/adducin family protein [Anaerolineales bacterium]|nr:class II aldolase/adducin family protein [Anaerolineales bacterium]